MNKQTILLKNNLIETPSSKTRSKAGVGIVGTILANFVYYGFVPSDKVYNELTQLSPSQLEKWWSNLEPVLKQVTGDDKKMDKFVVYKNFPEEVLNKTEAEYWVAQIFMYLGVPNEYFTEEEKERKSVIEELPVRVLHLVDKDSYKKIYYSLCGLSAAWTPEQLEMVKYFVLKEGYNVDTSIIPFKENMVSIVKEVIDKDVVIELNSATDVLRLAAGMSGGDVSLRETSKFKKFSRKERKFLLKLLEGNTLHLEHDFAQKKEQWKKLMGVLHPFDYKKQFPFLCHHLRHSENIDSSTSFNSAVEIFLGLKDEAVFGYLVHRPGEFVRRIRKLLEVYDDSLVLSHFKVIQDKLTVSQLLKLKKYLETINHRNYLIYPPKGNWNKIKVFPNKFKETINWETLDDFQDLISKTIERKVSAVLKEENKKFIDLDALTCKIKLQTNDSELTSYGRGTEFPIPDNVNFIRTASYWEFKGVHGSIWYDNGWNFFDKNWKKKGVCCWNNERLNDAAIFSGDPTNIKEEKGRACQMIDLYIDKLIKEGVRYAVWSVLCYSQRPFSEAKEVYAALQWGEKAQSGKLFEPSRCQLSFPIGGNNLTKFIAYIDLQDRTLVYMDANLPGNVHSAENNSRKLQEIMPAFVEYLYTLPDVYDLFENNDINYEEAMKASEILPVLYDDEGLVLENKEKAYVFKPVNPENNFTPIDITKFLK